MNNSSSDQTPLNLNQPTGNSSLDVDETLIPVDCSRGEAPETVHPTFIEPPSPSGSATGAPDGATLEPLSELPLSGFPDGSQGEQPPGSMPPQLQAGGRARFVGEYEI